MATSGSYTFDPTFAEVLEEAFERAGMDPADITQKHIKSAKASMNLMLTDWRNRDGDALYRIGSTTTAVSSGTDNFALTTGASDILDAVIDTSGDGVERPLSRISRDHYLSIPDKDQAGEPTVYYVDFSSLNAPIAKLWPVPDSNVTVRYDFIRYNETVDMTLSDTIDVRRTWQEALTCGLALRLAEKYNLDRVGYLASRYEQSYETAKRSSSGEGPVTIAGRGFGRARRRRSA